MTAVTPRPFRTVLGIDWSSDGTQSPDQVFRKLLSIQIVFWCIASSAIIFHGGGAAGLAAP